MSNPVLMTSDLLMIQHGNSTVMKLDEKDHLQNKMIRSKQIL